MPSAYAGGAEQRDVLGRYFAAFEASTMVERDGAGRSPRSQAGSAASKRASRTSLSKVGAVFVLATAGAEGAGRRDPRCQTGGDLLVLLFARGSTTVKVSAPGRIRTCGPALRRRVLYPLSYGRFEAA
jgi:hypothetical protein